MILRIFLPLGFGFLSSFFLGRREKVKNFLINFILYVIIPVFVIQVVWSAHLGRKEVLIFTFVAAVASAAGILISFILSKFLEGATFKDICLPVSFVNSGNLGIPAAGYLFGSSGIVYAVIFNASITLFIFTVGVIIVSGSKNIKEVLKIPVIYALAAGLILNRWGPVFPSSSLAMDLFSEIALFLMLALVGWRLSSLKASFAGHVLWICAGRAGAGLISAFILMFLLDLPSGYVPPAVLLVMMPSAINSYILAEKYDAAPQLSSGAVALTTIIFLALFSLL